MKEQYLQSKIIKYLSSDGWLPVKTIRVSPSGYPDIFAFKDGVTIAIEVKTPIGVVSPLQALQIARLNQQGIHAFVARSIEDVKSNLSGV